MPLFGLTPIGCSTKCLCDRSLCAFRFSVGDSAGNQVICVCARSLIRSTLYLHQQGTLAVLAQKSPTADWGLRLFWEKQQNGRCTDTDVICACSDVQSTRQLRLTALLGHNLRLASFFSFKHINQFWPVISFVWSVLIVKRQELSFLQSHTSIQAMSKFFIWTERIRYSGK